MKSYKLLLLCLYLLSTNYIYAQPGIITTIAGTGINASTGDGSPAGSANVTAMAVGIFDIRRNFLFMEGPGNRVRKISNFGIIDSAIGNGMLGFSGDNGLAIRAKMNNPKQTACDKQGNWYVCDAGNNRIRKVEAVSGIITTIAGNGTSGYTGDGGPASAALIGQPFGICMDSIGNIFYFDGLSSTIRKIDTFGFINRIAGVPTYPDTTGDGGPATAAHLAGVEVMKCDRYGNLYIGGFNIRKIDMATGIITKVAGIDTSGFNGDGHPATATAFFTVVDMCFNDQNGLLYIADTKNNRIRKIDSSGIVHTVVGTGVGGFGGDGGPPLAAQLHWPEGIAFDSCDNMYICDLKNYRIRKVACNGGITPAPVVGIAASPTGILCAGTPVTYTATVTGGGTSFYYQWYVNGALVSSIGATYTYAPANGDSVSCRVSTYTGCDAPSWAMSNTLHVVTSGALTVPTITLSGPSMAVPGTTVTITATVSGAGSSYAIRWMNHGIIFNTTSTHYVSYTKGPGTDTITALIVPEGMCYDSTLSTGHIVTADYTAITRINNQHIINITPNPAGNTLFLTGYSQPVNYHIYTITGHSTNITGTLTSSQEINITPLPPGLYLLQLLNNTGNKQTLKFIKE